MENTDNDNCKVVKDLAEQVRNLTERAKTLQDAASAFISRIKVEEDSIAQRAVALESDIRRTKSALSSARQKASIDPRDAEKLEEDLCRAHCMLTEGDVGDLMPSKVHGSFLKYFLGPANVKALRNDVRLKVKEEYNSYRDRTAILFLLFPIILLVMKNCMWNGCFPAFPVQLYQAWLLYFYTSLALREHVLRVNGSDIRPWWIYHHYCAMFMALVSLTWEIKGQPNCIEKQEGVRLFLSWAIMQGVAMLLQNRYQRQRLYTRIALGKARRMDVVWGETAGVEGQLWLLYPILFILQIFEGYIGLLLLRTVFVQGVSDWQVVVCGMLLLIMAIGNFLNTVETLVAKSRVKAKMKKTKSKLNMERSTSDSSSLSRSS
eukprot:TRINITY_DN1724_c0_g2_i1.p1 TRINITY_DN1724_c0_g2~~TRINITY_DN1724_c0_g2_i1.p1  ORF type:complete len:376 (+),score=50.84 TRINITY_DN1724_c0_g2_i1:613-1740(+)